MKNKDNFNKAVVYARYSSDKQTEQSIEGQMHTCEKYAKEHNITIVDKYIDRAMTGTNDNRAAFQKMIKDSSKKEWQYVLVYKLDRFSRNKYESAIHKNTLKQNGVKLVSVMELIPDNPEGILLESVLEGINQYYSAELSQKVKRGIKESLAKGKYPFGTPPFGYSAVNNILQINDKEADVLKHIYSLYESGYTGPEISKILAEENISNRGKPFSKDYIYKLLSNSAYTGNYEHDGISYPNVYPQIIEEEQFKNVNKIFSDNKGKRKFRTNTKYLLTPKLICGICHKRMQGTYGTSKTKKRNYYYMCPTARTDACNKKPVKLEYLDKVVMNAIYKVFKNKKILDYFVDKLYELHTIKKDKTAIDLLQKNLNDLNTRIESLVESLANGIKSEAIYAKLQELEDEKTYTLRKLKLEKVKSYNNLTKDNIRNYLLNLYKDNSKNEQFDHLVIDKLVRNIVIYPKKIAIVFRTDYTEFQGDVTEEELEILDNYCKESKNKGSSKRKLHGAPKDNCTKLVKKLLVIANFFFAFFVYVKK